MSGGLDSGEDKPDTSPVYAGLADFDRYRREQAVWLKSHIQTKAFQEAAFRVPLTSPNSLRYITGMKRRGDSSPGAGICQAAEKEILIIYFRGY
jgi:hypothetical protein